MNLETKIILSLFEKGAKLIKDEPKEFTFIVTDKDIDRKKLNDKLYKPRKIIRKGSFIHYPLINSKCIHQMNISQEAYDDMLNMPCSSYHGNRKAWKKLSIDDRLKFHFNEIKQHFNAFSFTYNLV